LSIEAAAATPQMDFFNSLLELLEKVLQSLRRLIRKERFCVRLTTTLATVR